MEIADPLFPTAVREAFTCYLGFLTHIKTVREATLPRQGKGVETTDDLSLQQDLQARVAITELCLQYTDRIASDVQVWADEPPDNSHDEDITSELREDEEPEWDFEGVDGQPFLDFFSGKWLEPITPFSPGPSGTQGGEPIKAEVATPVSHVSSPNSLSASSSSNLTTAAKASWT